MTKKTVYYIDWNAGKNSRGKVDKSVQRGAFAESGLSAEIEELNRSINLFINSPIGYLYRTRRREDMRSVQEISAA